MNDSLNWNRLAPGGDEPLFFQGPTSAPRKRGWLPASMHPLFA